MPTAATHKPCGPYEKYFKRPLDVILSGMALVVLSPVILVVALLIRIKLGSPVVFAQVRPGKDERLFKMYKFRSMTDERDAGGNLLPDNMRLTKFGRAIRDTSIDELLELWNILKGNMSIVGPRPQLVRDMVFMTDEQRRRHTVKPGLSGLAQIKGRNAISWEEKLSWDLVYLDNITFSMDLYIVCETVRKILGKKESAEELDTADDYGDALLKAGKITKSEYEEKQLEAKRLLERSV